MDRVRFVRRFAEQSSRQRPYQMSDRRYSLSALLWPIIGLGIALRLAQYLHNRSLWLDEAMLALSLVHRSLPELLLPLEYDQGAPLGFLVVETLLVGALGTHEYVLRLFPLICGIASLILFPKVAQYALSTTAAVLVATGTFALSYKLIFYASDVKQYSSDVAITLALYGMTQHVLSAGLTTRRALMLGIGGASAIWFSHPATFVLAGIGATLAGLFAYRRVWSSFWRLTVAGVLWVVSFGVCYFVSLRQLTLSKPMLAHWAGSFMPFPPKTFSELRWFDETFFSFFREPLGLFPVSLACVAFVVGCVSLAFRRKEQFLLLATPLLAALMASGFHLYPFGERLLLFAMPGALILIAEGIIRFGGLAPTHQHRLSGAVALMLLAPQGIYSSAVFFRPYSFQEVRPAIAYMSEHWQPGDLVYVYPASHATFRYYSAKYGFEGGDYVLGRARREDLAGMRRELEEAIGSRERLWVLISHINRANGVDDDSLFRAQIPARKALADSFKEKDAAVYLYVNATH